MAITTKMLLFWFNGLISSIFGSIIIVFFGRLEGLLALISVWILANQYDQIIWGKNNGLNN